MLVAMMFLPLQDENVNDVHEPLPPGLCSAADPGNPYFHFSFVVEARKPFVAIERQLVFGGHRPYSDRYKAAFARLDSQVGAGSAAFEQKPVTIFSLRSM